MIGLFIKTPEVQNNLRLGRFLFIFSEKSGEKFLDLFPSLNVLNAVALVLVAFRLAALDLFFILII